VTKASSTQVLDSIELDCSASLTYLTMLLYFNNTKQELPDHIIELGLFVRSALQVSLLSYNLALTCSNAIDKCIGYITWTVRSDVNRMG